MNLYPVICKTFEEFIEESQKFIIKYKCIKSISSLEKSNNQYVFILSDEVVSKDCLKMWWSGYQTGLGNINE